MALGLKIWNWLKTLKLASHIEPKMCLIFVEHCSHIPGHHLVTILWSRPELSHQEDWWGIEYVKIKWKIKTWGPWILACPKAMRIQMITVILNIYYTWTLIPIHTYFSSSVSVLWDHWSGKISLPWWVITNLYIPMSMFISPVCN